MTRLLTLIVLLALVIPLAHVPAQLRQEESPQQPPPQRQLTPEELKLIERRWWLKESPGIYFAFDQDNATYRESISDDEMLDLLNALMIGERESRLPENKQRYARLYRRLKDFHDRVKEAADKQER